MSILAIFTVQVAAIAVVTLFEKMRHKGPTDWLRNLQAWFVQIGTGLAFLPLIQSWNVSPLVDGTALPLWLGFALFLVVRDAAEFAFHLAQHKVPFLWRMHSLHHSDPEMTALTTNRHFWGDQLIKALTIWPLSELIIGPGPEILGLYGIVSLYNYVIHANLRIDFGRWSWALNCPAYHRRHHSLLPEHYDSNFAALLPVFDVICGTYRRPDGWPPTGQDRMPESLGELVAWPVVAQARVAEPARP